MPSTHPRTASLTRRLALSAAAVCGLAWAGDATSSTDMTGSFALEGRFVQVDQENDRASIEAGIDRVAAAFNPLLRPVVRPYLRHVTRYCPVPVFRMKDSELSFACGDTTVFTSSYDGHPFAWRAIRDDETYTVSQNLVRPDKLVQTFANDMGGREQTFELQADGETLVSQVTYHSDYLPVPFTYELRFRRTPSESDS